MFVMCVWCWWCGCWYRYSCLIGWFGLLSMNVVWWYLLFVVICVCLVKLIVLMFGLRWCVICMIVLFVLR